MNQADDILELLERYPEDWGLRLLAIENAVRRGGPDEARRFVRECPPEAISSPEIQARVHELLTQGVAALEEQPVPPEDELQPVYTTINIPPVPAEEEDEILENSDENAEEDFPPTYSGGLSALIDEEPTDYAEEDEGVSAPTRAEAPHIARNEVHEKWDGYEGGLELVNAEFVPRFARPSHTSEKFSSLTVAVAFHLILLLVIGMVVVQIPNPPPPKLIVSVIHEREANIVTPRLARITPEIRPAAATAQAIDVISAVNSSTFSVPDVDDAPNMMAVSMLPGIRPLGNGMSFSTDATKASDVNFFGISGSGKKVVFIIDATPQMLVDEKGGMVAYDNVKEEVGIMLANLNRHTHFNVLLYQGKRVVSFRNDLVPGLPSNLRLAIEWMDPLNREYEALGLRNEFGETLSVQDNEEYPIASRDVAHYTKAIQKAMEWEASAIFCIASGYSQMQRSPTPEMVEEMKKLAAANPGTPGTVSSGAKKAWQSAVAKTKAWLAKENAARREKGVSQKVVTNFSQLVQQRTGASPPRSTGGTPAGAGKIKRLPPATSDDIERQVKQLVKYEYKEERLDEPSLHMVVFLGEDERIKAAEDHFRRLTRLNNGKLKILRGLAAMEDVTSSQ